MKIPLSRAHPPTVRGLESVALTVVDGPGSPALGANHQLFLEPLSVLQEHLGQESQVDTDGDIGAAIAILTDRFPVSYTKSSAFMIAYCERTQRRLPDLASAVLKTYSPLPGDTAPGGGTGTRSANGVRVPITSERR